MAKQKEPISQMELEMETLGEAVNKTELFFEKNGKKVIYAIVALIVVAVGVYGYKAMVIEPRMEKASELIFEAQARIEGETPDYELALNGDAEGAGFLEVADSYGSTPAGNLAKHYAGLSYLHLGDYENAAKYLKQYNAVKGIPGAIINAQNLGLQGDIAVEQDDLSSAISLYKKAVAASDNVFTAPTYLFKAALATMANGDNAAAKSLFEQITVEYPQSTESRNAEKFLGSLE